MIIKQTGDGSNTLYRPDLNEHYHSVHGAVKESLHVFIEMGFNAIEKEVVDVFEMGFGTGLNAFLVAQSPKVVRYTTIESQPLQPSEWEQLDYAKTDEQQNLLERLHYSTWGETGNITDTFTLLKKALTFEEYQTTKQFDLIFWDAFGPRVQPELWTEDVFRKVFEMTCDGGVLVTYSAKGQVRRNLISAGFSVERLPGPPGKREMLRGRKR